MPKFHVSFVDTNSLSLTVEAPDEDAAHEAALDVLRAHPDVASLYAQSLDFEHTGTEEATEDCPVTTVPPPPADHARTLRAILALIGNVDHATGNGANAAKMRGDMLNGIRGLVTAALGGEG